MCLKPDIVCPAQLELLGLLQVVDVLVLAPFLFSQVLQSFAVLQAFVALPVLPITMTKTTVFIYDGKGVSVLSK